jgi:hypothetical protein
MEVVMSFLSSFGGSFGSVLSDSGFPGGYIKGFALSVDAITNDSSLGGNWQTMSLGTMEMHTNELPAGGYIRTSIREVERISYGEVTVARAWSPGTSARITEWFSWAAKNGSTSVAITVEVPSASEAGIGGLFASLVSSLAVATGMDPSDLPGKKFNIIFRDCYPKQWGAPQLTAGLLNQYTNTPQQATTLETLTFSFSGYKVETISSATALVDSSISTEEKVEPFKLVIIPAGGVSARMLASMSSWTTGQNGVSAALGLGMLSNSSARMIAGYAASLDSIQLYLPPASIRVKKQSSWYTKKSSKAKSSGPPTYLGPTPMKMSFQFLLKTTKLSGFTTGGLLGGLAAGGGLLGGLANLAGIGGDSLGFGKPRTVMDDLKKLVTLCESYSSGLFSSAESPPLVMLLWGQFASPLMYITELEADITRFGPDGTPTKAVGKLELRQFPSYSSGTNPTSGGVAPELAETVLQGDTLAHLAYRTYENPQTWRDIAIHNGVDDPLRVSAGRRMLLPSPDALPERGEGGGIAMDIVDDSYVDEDA